MSGFRYRLYSDDWDELGEFTTAVPNWSQGDEFMTGDGRRFRITGIEPVDDDVGVFNAFWKVEPIAEWTALGAHCAVRSSRLNGAHDQQREGAGNRAAALKAR